MVKGYLEYMTAKPGELEAYIRKNPIAYVPFGSLEWHGEHMVLGMDSLKATFLCQRCAEITGGVLFPCVDWGAFGTMAPFPFTPEFSGPRMTKLTRTLTDHLYAMGFRIIILLTGHYSPGQIVNVRKAAQHITKKHKDCFALGIPEHALAGDLGYLGEHAAEWETSIMIAINPALVDLKRIGRNLTFSERCARHGIIGRDPIAYASAKKGQDVIDVIVSRLTTAVQEVRTTYSAAPFDRIYKEFRRTQRQMYSLRHPLDFRRLFEAQGMENRHELWNFVKWKYFRGAKQIPDYTSYKK
jgi:creatinine amidohydrolase